MRIRLPKLDARRFHWLPLDVQDTSHDIDDLAPGAPWLTRQSGQIRGFLDRPEDGVKGAENFAWSPFERLGEYPIDRTRHGEGACRDRHPQDVPP
jgi:hypothetical protein